MIMLPAKFWCTCEPEMSNVSQISSRLTTNFSTSSCSQEVNKVRLLKFSYGNDTVLYKVAQWKGTMAHRLSKRHTTLSVPGHLLLSI